MARIRGTWADVVESEEVEEDGDDEEADVEEEGSYDQDGEEEYEEDGEEEEEVVAAKLGSHSSGDDDVGLNSPHSDPCSSSRKKRRWKKRVYGSSDSDDEELNEEDIWETQSLEQCSSGVCINASLKFSDKIEQESNASSTPKTSLQEVDDRWDAQMEEAQCAVQRVEATSDELKQTAQNSVMQNSGVQKSVMQNSGAQSSSDTDSGVLPNDLSIALTTGRMERPGDLFVEVQPLAVPVQTVCAQKTVSGQIPLLQNSDLVEVYGTKMKAGAGLHTSAVQSSRQGPVHIIPTDLCRQSSESVQTSAAAAQSTVIQIQICDEGGNL